MMQKKLELSRNAESASKNDHEENELVRLRAELKKVVDDRNTMSKKNEQLVLMCNQLNVTVKKIQNDYEAKEKILIEKLEEEKKKNNSLERYKIIDFLGGGAYGKVHLVEDKQIKYDEELYHRFY